MSSSRVVALRVLVAVDLQGAFANLALPSALRSAGLSDRDAGMATELTYGTLRRQGAYDAALEQFTPTPLDRIDPPVLAALRMGLHQLWTMRVAPHAAVHATLEALEEVQGRRGVGFANAILRRASREGAPTPPEGDSIEALAEAHAHPVWIATLLDAALGGDRARLEAELAANNEVAGVTLAAWPGRATRDELCSRGATPTRWSPIGAAMAGGDPARVAAVRERRAGVQDEGSQLVALALAAVPVSGREGLWIDLCAGPGGKAAVLAGCAADAGAEFVAVEQHPHRADLVRQALVTAPGDPVVLTADATEPPIRPGMADRILLDAPCSGLGSLRRRPEARWRKSREEIIGLVRLQRSLIRSAVRLARPGGVIAYVTCSPVVAETTGQVAWMQDTFGSAIEVLDARPYVPAPDLGPGPTVQLWPGLHGTDAMFLALIRKR